MSTHCDSTNLGQEELFPGSSKWPQPSATDIGFNLQQLKEAPNQLDRSIALQWLTNHAWHSWYGRVEGFWLRTLNVVDEPINRSIEWSLENDPTRALAVTGALARYWYLRNGYEIGAKYLALSLEKCRESSLTRARAMSGLVDAGLAKSWDMPPETVKLAEGAVKLHHELGNAWGEARAVWHLGLSLCYVDRPEETISCYWKALSMFREIGDPVGQANVLFSIASLPYTVPPIFDSAPPMALPHLADCLALFQSIGNEWGKGVALSLLLSHKLFLSSDQRAVVHSELLTQANDRWADRDHEGALESAQLAAEFSGLIPSRNRRIAGLPGREFLSTRAAINWVV